MKQKFIYMALFLSLTLNADQFSFSFYNDFFTGKDGHFTNGMNLSWMDDSCENRDKNSSNGYSMAAYTIVKNIPFIPIDKSKQHSAGISLSQIIITPADTTIETTQYDDIPYAGYLALNFYLFEWNQDNFKEFRVEVGVVGKESGAEFIQNNFHKMIGNDELKGWETQLGTQYTTNILFRYGEISWQNKSTNDLDMDWFNHVGFQVGNFTSNVFGGSMFRIGKNYIRNFNVHYPYLKEEASMLKLDEEHKNLGWSLSVGLNGEILAYSYILDEAKREGYETDKNIANIAFYAGLDLYYQAHQVTFFYQAQSPYTNQQNTIDTFGGFIYSYQF